LHYNAGRFPQISRQELDTLRLCPFPGERQRFQALGFFFGLFPQRFSNFSPTRGGGSPAVFTSLAVNCEGVAETEQNGSASPCVTANSSLPRPTFAQRLFQPRRSSAVARRFLRPCRAVDCSRSSRLARSARPTLKPAAYPFCKAPATTGLQIRGHESEPRRIGNVLQIRAVEEIPVIRLLKPVGSGASRQQSEKSRANIDAHGGKSDQGICDFRDQVYCTTALEAESGPCMRLGLGAPPGCCSSLRLRIIEYVPSSAVIAIKPARVARPNDIERGAPGPPRAREPARRKPPWRAGSGCAACIQRNPL
jgi:hypothetical protein